MARGGLVPDLLRHPGGDGSNGGPWQVTLRRRGHSSAVHAETLGDTPLAFCWGGVAAVGIELHRAGLVGGRRSLGVCAPEFLGAGTHAVVQSVCSSDKLQEGFVIRGGLEAAWRMRASFNSLLRLCSRACLFGCSS